MGQQPLPWREEQARRPVTRSYTAARCSNCEATAARRGEPVPASERGGGEARAARSLRARAFPPLAGRAVTARLGRRATAPPRPALRHRPPWAQARPQETLPRPPLPSPGARWRRATVRSRRRPSPSRDSGTPPRRRQGPTWDTPAFPYLPAWSREPAAPRIGRGRGGDPEARPGGGAAETGAL